MSSTADIADSAAAVQGALTTAETALGADLPDWYLHLREQIHGLVTSSAWAVGEASGAAIMGFRCEGRTHSDTCEAYRAADAEWMTSRDGEPLITCPRCEARVHDLDRWGNAEVAVCWPCHKEQEASEA
jgi:hypothetical protein